MQALRALVHRHRLLATLLVVCALVIKAAVPAGYMLGQHGKVLTIEICADASGSKLTQQIVVPGSGGSEQAGDHAKASPVCSFAALGFAALGGADLLLLGLALAFIIAIGLVPSPATLLRRVPHLRPPLRGPPAHA